MDEDERLALAKMPTEFTVYQGCTDERDDGWSWTTIEETARWFARRFADLEHANPVLRVARVKLNDVTAYFTRRNESEILIDPSLVVETHWIDIRDNNIPPIQTSGVELLPANCTITHKN
jgi:hypothetical protein